MPTPSTPRVLALGFAGLGLTAALAACSSPAEVGGQDTGVDPAADTSAEYADGTYVADGAYVAPSGQETITVEMTLADDIVTEVVVTPHATSGNAAQFQSQFAEAIPAVVEGRDIDTLVVSRVGGSSLTSGGFNQALAAIKAEALAG